MKWWMKEELRGILEKNGRSWDCHLFCICIKDIIYSLSHFNATMQVGIYIKIVHLKWFRSLASITAAFLMHVRNILEVQRNVYRSLLFLVSFKSLLSILSVKVQSSSYLCLLSQLHFFFTPYHCLIPDFISLSYFLSILVKCFHWIFPFWRNSHITT